MDCEIEQSLPIVSIIVLNYNGKKYIDGCFDSIAKILYPKNRFEVILVDNGSSDSSVKHVRKKYPWVKVAQLNKNYGFTGGNNAGAKLAKGDYVVFLNNDVVVDVHWLVELVNIVTSNPGAIVTSKSLFLDRPEIVDHAGSKATLIGKSYCVNFGRKNDKSDSSPRFVVQPYGASMLVNKYVFEEIGSFDEDYFTSLEDTDLGLRAWLGGHKVIYVPTSIFYHVGGGTGGWGLRVSNVMTYHVTKNSYMNVLKCYDFRHSLQGVMLSLFYYTFAVICSIKERKLGAAKSILQAHVWIIKNAGYIIKKRFDIQKKRRIPHSFLCESSFFATLPEMMREHSYIQKYNSTRHE